MSSDLDCPLCDRKLHTWQELADHLVLLHGGHTPANGAPLHLNKKRTVRCWRRSWFALGATPMALWISGPDDYMGRFAEHLKRRGGPAAHLLEITLGVKR